MSSREQNEHKFPNWVDLPNGGRRYWREVRGHRRGYACYVKEVDAGEQTIKFYQEIYDAEGKLIEIHAKFPINKGHQKVR
jgi:hypothetical protein